MKKIITGIAAFALAAMVFAESTLPAFAMNKSYTYNYDYWGDVQNSPDFYSVQNVYTTTELGLDKPMKTPQGLYAFGDSLYVCDTGNNRIIELSRGESGTLSVVRYIDEFKGDLEVTTFSSPTDVAISEEGDMYIADKGNARILKLDKDLNYVMQFNIPVDASIEENTTFQPNKLAIDTAGRVYCVATGINKGLIKYEPDGTFSQFLGATEVSYNFLEYLKKRFATQAQREKMVSFVPTEYDNIYMDYEGFIYACIGSVKEEDLKAGTVNAVRRLNMMGQDILVRNGEFPVYGDIYMGNGGGVTGPSRFTDVTCFDNDVYVCLDKNRGRLFGYDDQGELVFAFGGNGNHDGYFRQPTAIEHIGTDLYVLDGLSCSITVFATTEFGQYVYDAMEQFDKGEYDASEQSWIKAKELNGNYNLAYIGIGRALLRQEKYKEAMEYFELKYDADNYSKAYKQYRKIWIEENIGLIVLVIVLVFLVPLGIGKVRSIKREIDMADIFRV
ncbi:MAG: hypothetical protein IKK33_06195 [Lachnospiraceae bacterium]|nr:hypothetical protein [Lachnospiraceae bacterium]